MSLHLASRTRALAQSVFGTRGIEGLLQAEELSHRDLIAFLLAYYESNGLYDVGSAAFREEGVWKAAMKPLQNPSFPAVEFYPMTLWPGSLPGALPIETSNDAIIDPIHTIWQWSNWTQKKQLAAREFPLTGDMFIKVSSNEEGTKVFIEAKKSANVSDFETDEMGHVTMLRWEVSVWDKGKSGIWTELWDEDGFKQWTHRKGFNAKIDDLGKPDEAKTPDDLGIDFVPWAHASFRDIGEKWGLPLLMPAIDKIDELNRKATRLDQIMFRYGSPPLMVSADSMLPDGRQSIPAKFSEENVVTLRDEEIYYLAGMTKIDFLFPDLKWAEYRARIAEGIEDLSQTLPELQYFELIKEGAISGTALRYKMAPAISRVEEARGSGEAAIVRADMMALEIAQNLKLDGFTELAGTLDDGGLEHKFADRDVLPLTGKEKAETGKTMVEMGVPLAQVLVRVFGWTEEEALAASPAGSSIEGTAEEQADKREATQEALVAQLAPQFETFIQVGSDAMLDFALRSGAIDRVLAEAAGNNGAG